MKICTITCHDVYNYGASLQAFALQEYLKDLGHDVKIIDYKAPYQLAYKFSIKVSKESKFYGLYQKYPILKTLHGVKKYLLSLKTKGRIKAFDNFKHQYFQLTPHYDSYQHLAECPPDADVYIAGSDQIWNTELSNGSDPAYYLQFGKKETKRLSFAASFANPEISGGYNVFVNSMLKSLDSISVREFSGLDILKSFGINGLHVLDPVFLLSAERWLDKLNIKSENRIIKDKYILVYDLKKNKTTELRDEAKRLSIKYQCKIVAVNDREETSYADININSAGPVEFVNLIVNCEAVLADSFHASAFSVIFHKPMWIYYHSRNVARIQDLLEIVGLPERLNPKEVLNAPQWNNVQMRLEKKIKEGKDFLYNNL